MACRPPHRHLPYLPQTGIQVRPTLRTRGANLLARAVGAPEGRPTAARGVSGLSPAFNVGTKAEELGRCGQVPSVSCRPPSPPSTPSHLPRPPLVHPRPERGGRQSSFGMASSRMALLALLTCALLLGGSSSVVRVEAISLPPRSSPIADVLPVAMHQQLIIGQWTMDAHTPYLYMQQAAESFLGQPNNTQAMSDFVLLTWVGPVGEEAYTDERERNLFVLLNYVDSMACPAARVVPRVTMNAAKKCKELYNSCRGYGVDGWCDRCAEGCLVVIRKADGSCGLAHWALKHRDECVTIPRGPLLPPDHPPL